MNNKRVKFASKIGIVAAATGSAVGLGNIWRFPSETADGGGAIFIFAYLLCILFFGIPLMVAEFIIGRSSQSNAAGAFHKLSPGTKWKWIGWLGILAGFAIMGFYTVVCGWTLDYFIQSVSGNLHTVTDFSGHFNSLLNNHSKQAILMTVFTVTTAFFILSGVRKGIEQSSKILMPILFLLLIVLAVRAVSLPGSASGLRFLLMPDMQHVKSTLFLDALGQAFFSLSIGMGCMITYASYFNKKTNLTSTAFQVAILDSLVAILAGAIIFPAAFALAPNSDSIINELVAGGPGLLFITLPELFNQMPAPILWASLFFLLLSVAALTSAISLMEVVTVYVHEEYQLSRRKSTILVTIGIIALGIISSFSSSFFNLLDKASAQWMMPISGMFVSLFVGWHLNKRLVEAQLTNDNKLKLGVGFLRVYIFLLRYVCPTGILAIFIYGLIG